MRIYPIGHSQELVKSKICACCKNKESQHVVVFSQWYFQNYCHMCLQNSSAINSPYIYVNEKLCDGCNSSSTTRKCFFNAIDKTGGIGIDYCRDCVKTLLVLVENLDGRMEQKFYDFVYSPKRKHLPKGLRHEVLKQNNYKCVECGVSSSLGGVTLEVDHIVPVSRGGTDDLSNLQTLCKICNREKGDLVFRGGTNDN